ncbi:MAG: hypothetical protein KatS3mg034_1863 [Vicingaceae bacterium]|nr:MAG: hypothetical protein KatS3mg034_1863 [Vicingaceae bacterium]
MRWFLLILLTWFSLNGRILKGQKGFEKYPNNLLHETGSDSVLFFYNGGTWQMFGFNYGIILTFYSGDTINQKPVTKVNRMLMEWPSHEIAQKNVTFSEYIGEHRYYRQNQLSINQVYDRVDIKNVLPGLDLSIQLEENEKMLWTFTGFPEEKNYINFYFSEEIELKLKNGFELNFFGGKLSFKEKFIEKKFQDTTNFIVGSTEKFGQNCTILKFDPLKNKNLSATYEVEWFSFFGGTDADAYYALDTDGEGNVYVAGYSISPDFPVVSSGGFFQSVNYGSYITCCGDGLIVKYNNQGQILWSTFFGGSGGEFFYDITILPDKSVYLCGNTYSTDYPVQPKPGGYIQNQLGGGWDATIVQFDSAANLIWSTYLGGSDDEYAHQLGHDVYGNIYVTGISGSSDWMLTNISGNFQSPQVKGALDGFIISFNQQSVYRWGGFVGGTGSDYSNNIAITPDRLWLTGYTNSNDFPLKQTGAYFQTVLNGGFDNFLLALDLSGNLIKSTYLGGSGNDLAYDLINTGENNLYMMGFTSSQDLPLKNSGKFFQNNPAGNEDIFLMKLDTSVNILWSTYLGGSGTDRLIGSFDHLTVDSCDNLFVTFSSASSDLPITPSCDGQLNTKTYTGLFDIAIAAFSKDDRLMWLTYAGGDGSDQKSCIGLTNNHLFVGGEVNNVLNASSYPRGNINGDTVYHGGSGDAFLMFYKLPDLQPNIVKIDDCGGECTGKVFTNGTCEYKFYNSDYSTFYTDQLCAGNYSIMVESPFCRFYAETIKIENLKKPTIHICCDTNISSGTSAHLIANADYPLVWLNQDILCKMCSDQWVNPVHTQEYCVRADNYTCTNTNCVTVYVDEWNCGDVFVPNIFSPNNDGRNDEITPLNNCIEYLEFRIYDRWGNLVFESIDKNKASWDGTFQNKQASEGIYYYFLKVKLFDKRVLNQKGSITLIR